MSDSETLSVTALERFDQPRNQGPLATSNGHARITGPCGDTIEIWLEVVKGKIAKASFTTTGCGPSRASGSMATELAVGKPLEEAARIKQNDILNGLGGLPERSRHCARLASDTLKVAIEDHRQGT